MKLFGRKQYVIGVIIIVLILALSILEARSEEPIPVMSEQFGSLTYAIAVKQECSGTGISIGNGQWPYRLPDSDCEIKYYHLIGRTGYRPALVAITERMPTETMMNFMLHKYIRTITQGVH